MRSATQKKVRKDGNQYMYTSFLCGTYSRGGKSSCSPHIIGENKLYDNVLEQIRNHAKIATMSGKHIAEDISMKVYGELFLAYKNYLNELKEHQKRMTVLSNLMQQLFEDKVNELISISIYTTLMNNYNQEFEEHQQKIWELEKHIRSFRSNENNASKWVSLIRDCTDIESLNTQIMLSLVERIIVNETPTNADKQTKDIKIIYKYVGDVSWLV